MIQAEACRSATHGRGSWTTHCEGQPTGSSPHHHSCFLFAEDYDALLCPKHANCKRKQIYNCRLSLFFRIANADILAFRIAN